MAITYTWSAVNMSVLQTPEPNYVVYVDWVCSGTDGTNTSESGGDSQIEGTEGGTFVPYADLTESEVLDWVFEALGTNGITSAQGCVEGQINSIVTPPVSPTSEAVPW